LAQLVSFLEVCINPLEALKFANEHCQYVSLCRLAFKIGEKAVY